MHEHKECEHELSYYKTGDFVYCEKCDREWIGKLEIIPEWDGSEGVTSSYC